MQVISLWDEPLDAHFNLCPGWVLTLVLREVLGSCCRLISSPGSVFFYSGASVLGLARIVEGMSCPSRGVSGRAEGVPCSGVILGSQAPGP